MLKTPIVVGIDFSAGSDAATKQAVRLARAWKATLLCVHIIDEQGVANLAMMSHRAPQRVTNEALEHAAEQLRTALRLYPEARRTRPRLLVGRPVQALTHEVSECGAGTLVLGACGRGGARVPGKVASRCLWSLPSDVLLVQRRQVAPFRRVVICVDLGPDSLYIAHHAAAMVGHGGFLEILHVQPAPPREPIGSDGVDPREETDGGQEREELELGLGRLAARVEATRPNVEVRTLLSRGWNYRPILLEHVMLRDADLVVVGHHRRSRVGQWLLGSTATWLLPRLACSLLAVKTPPSPRMAWQEATEDVSV
jgi:universal stress protein E